MKIIRLLILSLLIIGIFGYTKKDPNPRNQRLRNHRRFSRKNSRTLQRCKHELG